MIDHTVKLKESMEEMRTAKMDAVLKARTGVKWIEAAEIDRLFEQTTKTEEELAAQMAALRAKMEDAKRTYAVDGPDGDSDGHLKEEMLEINHIIEDAAAHEDKEAILRQRAAQAEALKTFAVDGPDGDSDGHLKEELSEINHIIDDAAVLEDKDAVVRKHKVEDKLRKEHTRDPEHDW